MWDSLHWFVCMILFIPGSFRLFGLLRKRGVAPTASDHYVLFGEIEYNCGVEAHVSCRDPVLEK